MGHDRHDGRSNDFAAFFFSDLGHHITHTCTRRTFPSALSAEQTELKYLFKYGVIFKRGYISSAFQGNSQGAFEGRSCLSTWRKFIWQPSEYRTDIGTLGTKGADTWVKLREIFKASYIHLAVGLVSADQFFYGLMLRASLTILTPGFNILLGSIKSLILTKRSNSPNPNT